MKYTWKTNSWKIIFLNIKTCKGTKLRKCSAWSDQRAKKEILQPKLFMEQTRRSRQLTFCSENLLGLHYGYTRPAGTSKCINSIQYTRLLNSCTGSDYETIKHMCTAVWELWLENGKGPSAAARTYYRGKQKI